MTPWPFVLAVVVVPTFAAEAGAERAPSGATAPEALKKEQTKEKKKRIQFDFSFEYDPLELRRWSRQTPRRVPIKGPVGIGSYYLPPALDNLPGPPLHIWGTGWGASVWRDPVTGRYER